MLARVGEWWRLATAGTSAHDLNRRPDPTVWSALEYGLHSAMVLPILRIGIEVMLFHDRSDVRDPCPDVDIEDASRPLTLDPESVLVDLEREGAAISTLVQSHAGGWQHLGLMEDCSWWQAEATLLHAVHDTTHHFMDVGEGLARIGAASPTGKAKVASVTVSDSARPPPPFRAVRLCPDGPFFQGSRANRTRSGRTGIQVTLSGIDWDRLRPGTRVSAGEALLELSFPVDGQWYAWVRRHGRLAPGDPALVSPPVTEGGNGDGNLATRSVAPTA